MSQQELLNKVIGALNKANIEYMLSGSFASSLQGEPRLTHDIDIVVAIQKEDAGMLVSFFDADDYYVDEQSIVEAVNKKDMFNLIDVKEGDKVDFWLLTDEAFDKKRFERRQSERIMGLEVKVSSPEDTILAKLKWAKLSGGSEKQFIDAIRVYEVQFEKLDQDYLRYWTKQLNLEKEFDKIVDGAEPIET